MCRKREVLLISSIRTTMVFSYSKVLPNPWENTALATIIIYQSLVQFLHSRHENSTYTSKHSIEAQSSISNSARISNYSKGNLQEKPHSYLHKQERWKLHIKTDKQQTIERTNSVEQPNTSCVHIKLTFLFNVRSS